MPLISTFTAVAARALGLTNGAPPGPPIISDITQTSTSISFNITAVLGSFTIARMEVQRDGGPWVQTDTLTSHTFTGLTSSTTYNFQVRAVDVTGQIGSPSELQTVTTNNEIPPSQPATVTLTQKSTTSDGSNAFKLDLSFTGVPLPLSEGQLPVSSYQYRITKTSDSSVIIDWTITPSGPGVTFIVSGLQPSTGYTAAVRAISSSGAQGDPRTATATTAAPRANDPPTVTLISENRNSAQTAASLTFRYGVSSGGSYPVVGYFWKLHTAAETTATSDPNVNVTTPEYTAGTTVTISVRSVDSAGIYSSYGVLTQTIAVTKPSAPSLSFPSGWNSRIDQVTLRWTRTSNTTSYKLYVGGSEVSTIAQPSSGTYVTYTYTGITEQSYGYTFTVKAFNDTVASDASNSLVMQSGAKNVPFTLESVPGLSTWNFARADTGCTTAGQNWAWSQPSYANDNFVGYRNITQVRMRLREFAGTASGNITCPSSSSRETWAYWPGGNKELTTCFGGTGSVGQEYSFDTNFNSGQFYISAQGVGTSNGWFSINSSCAFTSTTGYDSMTGFDMRYSGVKTTGHISFS